MLDRPCRESDCEHGNKSGVWWVAAVNISFTLLNIFHLAYLGLMFGGAEDDEVGLEQQVHECWVCQCIRKLIQATNTFLAHT